MEPDFSGYATKVGLVCSDGRTIMPHAFKHQDQMQVPLVWQHGHKDPENVLGHVVLENRDDGVYCYGYFNGTPKAVHTKSLVAHKDISSLSIWANQLVERSKKVMHGAIREVSLVLSGANPGALIDNVTIRHSDGEDEELDDEIIVFTGLPLVHSVEGEKEEEQNETNDVEDEVTDEELKHEQDDKKGDAVSDSDRTVKDVYDEMTQEQKDVLHFMVGEAISANSGPDSKSDSSNDNAEHGDDQEGSDMSNVFDQTDSSGSDRTVLSHDDMQAIVSDAQTRGSLKHAVEAYALSHGITDIDLLFPDAKLITDTPEFLSRRMEWVSKVLGGARKSPFARIKTIAADITPDEARAKGYITGEIKREEFFGVTKRETTPQTVYKKQKLDRDDIIDITDFDVVAWLKGEMRMMMDEELARAALIGDGRDVAHEDKIGETHIRPIATDHELFTSVVNVNLSDASSSIQELIDALVTNRKKYKGSGLPTLFTSETIISRILLLKDTVGRRIYNNLSEFASEVRVSEVVPVEAMDDDPTIVCILVNMTDYVFGTDKGGELNMFDDFDIDYNQYKYLMESRVSGALTRLKSAIVVKQVASTDVLVAPAAPTFDEEEGEVTIVNTTGVVYKNGAGTVINAAGSPYTVTPGTPYVVNATPAAGYYFATSDDDSWTFNVEA